MNNKLILSLVAIVTISLSSFGQTPEGFKYQAVVRNASNTILTNQAVGLRMTIQQGAIGGTTIYSEKFAPTTTANGLVNVEIGNGTPIKGTFANINWANGPYYIETAVDITGGTSYTVMGTSQLMSVPYALYAKTSGNGQGPAGPQGIQGLPGTNGAVGATGLTGSQGPAGNNGKSAYQIAVANGYVGTEAQWLTSLQGAVGSAGTNGNNGQSAYQLAAANGYVGTEAQWLTSLQGAVGSAGNNGNNGQSAYQLAVTNGYVGSEAQWLTSLKGTTGAAGTNAGVGGFTHYLGEAFNGGIIYYLYKGSDGLEHGLIVALTESTGIWQTTATLVNANRTEDGAYNTSLMTDSPVASYIATLGTGWYLPSIDELGLLYYNRYGAQKGLRAGGNTLLSNSAFYWSSTEFYQIGFNILTDAWFFSFFDGFASFKIKTDTNFVRAVRAF
jgi:hypothetical protein